MGDRPVAIVTGASRGIGAAIALDFARRGYDLCVTAPTEEELNESVAAVKSLGAQVIAPAGDLVDLSFAQSLVQQAANVFGRLDVLVNNAAWREIVTMRQIAPESWDKTLRICLTAPAFLARWAASTMESRGRGVIINISSMMSANAAGYAPAYVAAKGGMDALTYDLAALYGPAGIRVVAVNPGAVDTEMGKGYGETSAAAALREFTENMIPLRRWAAPDEIAKLVTWLAGEDASYITGTTIVADGGWSRQLHSYKIKHQMMPEQFK